MSVKSFLPAATAAVILAAATGAQANEAQIRRVLEPKLGPNAIEGVAPAPIPSLWEVRLRTSSGPQIVYTDATGAYLIQGSIFELRTGRDLTEERFRKITAIKFESLPLDQAVKIQRGNGRRLLAMFSDPYCPYCLQFEKNLLKIDDITVYVFMFPVIRPQNADHSKAVWCSADRAKAWLDLALHHKPPAAPATCENPVEKNIQYGRSLGVNSTPTLILGNGERIAGGMSAANLQQLLDRATAEASSKR